MRVREHEGQCGGGQGDIVALGDCFDPRNLGDYCGGGRAIIVMDRRTALRARRQDSAIVGAADDYRSAGFGAAGHQIDESILFEQRIAPRQQYGVEPRTVHHVEAYGDFVHADAEAADCTFVSQSFERLETTAARKLFPIACGRSTMGKRSNIMNIQDVDPRRAEPLQTMLVAAQDAVVRIVISHLERHW